jgi:magnesium chelatase subunit I
MLADEKTAVARVSDIYAALPAITGKLELEYEGELVGGHAIARELIRRAAEATFKARAADANVDEVVIWFDGGGALQVTDDAPASTLAKAFASIPGLIEIARLPELAGPKGDDGTVVAACELVLEALVARKRVSRSDAGRYGRATPEKRRRPNEDLFGGGMSA